ncbi:FG-GAP-like repeat-containing protein [Arthrobacter sp. HS15c]|uniref:FG-GAP-like repeat-containing protein n=1 Tax=Arthrobacter sp. HS15c TaxID=3230279 RepID=UPI0034675312
MLGFLAVLLTPALAVASGGAGAIPTLSVEASDPPLKSAADVLTVDAAGQLKVFHSDGAGHLGFPVTIGSGWANAKSFYVVDWDADGLQDILSQWSDGRLKVHPGTDNSGFGLPIEVGTGWQEKSITVGPWNNADEYPGILAKDTEGALTYYPNASGAKLDSGRQVGQGFVGYQITQIDFDGDGNQDIAARNTSGTMLLFRSAGEGDFIDEPRQVIGSGWNVMTHVSPIDGLAGSGTSGITARTGAGEFLYYPVDHGAWGSVSRIGSAWHETAMISGAALPSEPSDEINPADIISADPEFDLLRYRSTGSGAFFDGEQVGTGWIGLRAGFVTDWNADGVQDLVAHWADGRLSMYPGAKGGGFSSPISMGSEWQDWTLTVGSWVNSDRFPSLLGYDSQGRLFQFLNLGGSSVSEGTQIGTGWNGLHIVLADLDKDARTDIVAQTPDGALWLYRSSGEGALLDAPPQIIGSGWHAMTGMLPTSGFAGANTTGIIGRTPEGDLRYYPMGDSLEWGTPTIVGRGWNGFTLFGSPTS